MSLNKEGFRPIVNADKLSFGGLLHALLNSPILVTNIRIGKLQPDGRTVQIGKKSVVVDYANAKPGDTVITHEF